MANYYGSSQKVNWSADAYLAHYGVLGMKWGERHFQNKDGTWTESGKKHRAAYEYKSWQTKHNEKKAVKAAEKIKKATNEKKKAKLLEKKARYERRAERGRELDRREQEYSRRVSVAGNLAARILTSGFWRGVGSKPYQQYVAMMNAQGKGHMGKKVAALAASTYGGRLASTLVKAAYLRGGERKYIKEQRADNEKTTVNREELRKKKK